MTAGQTAKGALSDPRILGSYQTLGRFVIVRLVVTDQGEQRHCGLVDIPVSVWQRFQRGLDRTERAREEPE